MKKRCSQCKFPKDESEFCKDRSRPDGLNHRCRLCNRSHVQNIAAKQKKQFGKKKYRRRRRKYELTHYYGISVEDYAKLVKNQGDKCAICGTKPEAYLAIDHCHETNRVRGLLCRKCNSAIGLFDDDIHKIENALMYLKSKGTEIFFQRGTRVESPVDYKKTYAEAVRDMNALDGVGKRNWKPPKEQSEN
jgi:hypothetical protein